MTDFGEEIDGEENTAGAPTQRGRGSGVTMRVRQSRAANAHGLRNF
ncbi:MAG TPA: hypothetical protein VF458_13165 [Ktedonobacteraceae bacterium]